MKRPLILTAACALACAGTVAQINSPDARGYLERAILMCDDRNFEGCLDQMSHLRELAATAEQRELPCSGSAMPPRPMCCATFCANIPCRPAAPM